MKYPITREVLLLCLPVLLVGSGFGWIKWQERFRTDRISLDVSFQTQLPKYIPEFSTDPPNFTWNTELRGGPKSNYHLGWNEKIIAITPRGKTTVWKHNKALSGWNVRAVGGSENQGGVETFISTGSGLNRLECLRRSEIDLNILPLDTQQLEWQVEVAAIPSDDSEIWHSPQSSSTLETWRNIRGSGYLKKSFAIAFDPKTQGPIKIDMTRSKQHKSYVEISVSAREGIKRNFRRLVASDGKTRRTLWTDSDRLNKFCTSFGTSGKKFYKVETFGFDLTKAPASWGEITFVYDTVYDINKRTFPLAFRNDEWVNEKELEAFEKRTGGMRLSKRIVVRPEH